MSFDHPDLQAYRIAVKSLCEILDTESMEYIFGRWRMYKLSTTEKLVRAESLLRWEAEEPGWLVATYGDLR